MHNSLIGLISLVVWPLLVFYCRRVLASASGGHKMENATSQGERESLESETSLQVWRNCLVWNINAVPHPFFCLPSTSCHSHCNNHLSPLSPSLSFLIVHPPSALFSSPSSLVTCHPLHLLLLALLSWFPSYSSSHLTSFRSSVLSLALPQGGFHCDR